jgi:cholesterol oxidase
MTTSATARNETRNETRNEARNEIEHVDALVVGSGFGGSVTALRLAEAGLGTVVLERGRAYPPGAFPRSPHEVSRALWDPSAGLHGLFQMWRFGGFDSLTSSGLGGGSLIYANVLLRKDEKWFVQDDPLPGGGYETWPVGRADLDPHYDRVEKVLGGTPYPFGDPAYADTAKTAELIAAAEKSGLDWQLPPLAVSFSPRPEEPPGLGLPIPLPEYGSIHGVRYGTARRTCRLLGECDLGCNEGAKNSLDHTYLSAAVHAGADVRVLSEVTSIRPDDRGGRRGYLVDYVQHDPDRSARTLGMTTRRIHCDQLVLAAGTYGTSWLLLRNRDRLPGIGSSLGTRFSGNGDLLTFLLPAARGRRLELDASRGPVITVAVRVPDRLDGDGTGRGYYVEDGGYPGFVDWMLEDTDVTGRLFRFGEFLTRWAAERFTGPSGSRVGRELSRLIGDGSLSGGALPLLGMGRDVPDGTFLLDGDERLQATWRTDTSHDYFASVRRTMRTFAETLGTDYLDNPIWFFKRVISVHPLGGAPMGRTAAEGVCDPHGEVWNHPGLWIADGSAMPGPVGANPSLTIAAWADRLADRLLETRGRPPAKAGRAGGAEKSRTAQADSGPGTGRTAAAPATSSAPAPAAPTALSFTEEMKGFFTPGEADPPTGGRLGRAAQRRLSFHLTITADDVDRFLAEPGHPARAEGWVEAEALGGRRPVEFGRFNLFTQGEQRTSRHLSYLLHFSDQEGAPVTLSGRKEVHDGPATDIWPDTSTLYLRLLGGHLPEGAPEGDAPILGAGVLHILKPDFVRELASLRVSGGDPARSARAGAAFARFFLGNLYEVYGRHLGF